MSSIFGGNDAISASIVTYTLFSRFILNNVKKLTSYRQRKHRAIKVTKVFVCTIRPQPVASFQFNHK